MYSYNNVKRYFRYQNLPETVAFLLLTVTEDEAPPLLHVIVTENPLAPTVIPILASVNDEEDIVFPLHLYVYDEFQFEIDMLTEPTPSEL